MAPINSDQTSPARCKPFRHQWRVFYGGGWWPWRMFKGVAAANYPAERECAKCGARRRIRTKPGWC